MSTHRKNILLLGLALLWSVGWGIRAAVEASRADWGWTAYSVLLFLAGVAGTVSLVRKVQTADSARARLDGSDRG